MHKTKEVIENNIVAFYIVMFASRTEVAIRICRTIAIDVRMSTTMIKVIRIVTTDG